MASILYRRPQTWRRTGVAEELVASIATFAVQAQGVHGDLLITWLAVLISSHGSRLISGLSYKTAFSNELLTSIFPL